MNQENRQIYEKLIRDRSKRILENYKITHCSIVNDTLTPEQKNELKDYRIKNVLPKVIRELDIINMFISDIECGEF